MLDFIQIFQRIFQESEEKVELHEKRLLITFWRRRVRKSTIAHFVVVMTHFLNLCRSKCQFLDFIQIVQRIFQESEQKVELHEKRLLITFWRRRVRKSLIAHFVAVIMYFLGLCRNKCQLLDFIQICQRIFQENEEKVELHEKRLLITFWKRRVRKSTIAHFVVVMMHFLSLCRSKCQFLDFIQIFQRIFQESEEKVELHEKRLLITFWRRRVRKSTIAHFVVVMTHFLNLCRSKCQFLDFIQIFQRIFQESEQKVELHEKRLLITFWRRRVRKSLIAHFVAVIMYFLGLCRNKCQLLDFIQICQRIFQENEEKVELHEKRLLITFWKRRVRKSTIAHFVVVMMHFLSLCRSKCQFLDFIQIFQRIFQESEEKVELHEKRLLITFWRRGVRKSMRAHFVVVIMYFLGLCRNKCQLLYFIQIFQRTFQESEEKVELHEKRLLITFWRRQVRKSKIAHFVAVIMYLLGVCRNKCQLLDFIQIFQRIFQESEEKVELHENRLFLTFLKRRVRKSMIAHFFAVKMHFLGLCRNKCQLLDFIQIFQRTFQESEEKVELHEKRLLITFWRRRVRKSTIAHFVVVMMHFLSLFRSKCQFLDFIQIFQRFFQESEEKVELHEKRLLITFWRRQVIKSKIAHLVAVIM